MKGQRGMEEAAVMMVGLESQRVLQGLEILSSQSRGDDRDFRLVADYSMPNVASDLLGSFIVIQIT